MCLNQKVYNRIIQEVGEWAAANFGVNASHWPTANNRDIVLDHSACVLGIVEEMGELMTGVIKRDVGQIKDSIADVMIYLADYLYRTGIPLDAAIDWKKASSPARLYNQSEVIGWFCHINLKRHQGIRGYLDDAKFLPELRETLTRLVSILAGYFAQDVHPGLTTAEGVDAVVTLTASVWEEVKKRNWTAKPETGT